MPKRSQPASPHVRKPKHVRKNLGILLNYSYSMDAAETWTALGSCAATMGILPLALKAFELALAHAPGSLSTLLAWSQTLRMNDVNMNETVGCQAALQRLTKALEQFPELGKLAEMFKELTECYLLVNLNEAGQQAVQQAVQLQPRDASLFLLLAQSFIRMGMRQQAASLLRHCLKLLPKSLLLFSAADVETARTAHAELAAIAAAEGNIESSINELTASLMLPPPSISRINEHIALWCALATALERANKIPEALDACERAQLAVGRLPRILITHAYLLLLDELKSRAEQAVQLLTHVMELEPRALDKPKETDLEGRDSPLPEDTQGDFLPWCLLGKAYTLLDSPRAAYDSYQIALQRADGSPITWLAVGKLYLELKQLPDALAAYLQALRLQLNENSPGTAAAWDGLSCVYERCDDQLGDAADACSRAALCFQAYGDSKSAEFYENRAKNLRLAAQGKAPVPKWSEPVGVSNYFLRDLVNLLPSERIAIVRSINKGEAMEAAGQSGSPVVHEQKLEQAKGRHSYETPLMTEQHLHQQLQQQQQQQQQYQGRGLSTVPYRQAHPYDSIPRETPPPGHQPQYVHAGTSSHVVQVGLDRPGSQPPAYVLAPAYSSNLNSKLPMPAPQHMHNFTQHYWQGHDLAATAQTHPMTRGPPPILAQYGPPPADMMSSSSVAAQAIGGSHRSPVALPQVAGEAYSMALPPGYAYGQELPMHGGMVAQMQPYGGAHWRR